MSYFKASICINTEELELNSDGVYESCNPNTYQDHGVIRTFTAPTLLELKTILSKEFFNLDKPIGANVQIFENRIEIRYSGEHDYRTPKSERIPFIETASVYIEKITSEEVDLTKEPLFSKIERY